MDKTIREAVAELLEVVQEEGFEDVAVALTFKRSEGKTVFGITSYSDDEILNGLVKQVKESAED